MCECVHVCVRVCVVGVSPPCSRQDIVKRMGRWGPSAAASCSALIAPWSARCRAGAHRLPQIFILYIKYYFSFLFISFFCLRKFCFYLWVWFCVLCSLHGVLATCGLGVFFKMWPGAEGGVCHATSARPKRKRHWLINSFIVYVCLYIVMHSIYYICNL